MKKRSVPVYLFVICLISLSIFLTSDIFAAVMPNTNSASVTSLTDQRIDTFEGNTAYNWTDGLNVRSHAVTDVISPYPFKPYEGTYCLLVKSEDALLGDWRTVVRTFPNALNLSDYGSIHIALNLPELDEYYKVNITLYGGDGSSYADNISGLKSGQWNSVIVDISEYSSKDNITSISISTAYRGSYDYTSEYVYYIDMLGIFRSADPRYDIKYLTSNYYVNGGSLSVDEDSMILTVNNDNPSIETYSFNPDVLDGANSIKLEFSSSSDCSAVTFYYSTTRNPSFSIERSYILAAESEGDVQTCYFPVNRSNIEQIRFVFNNATHGEIEIYSITPASSYAVTSTGYGTVDECVISQNKREINISGTLNEDVYEELRNMSLELYSIGINDDDTNVLNYNLTPVAQIKVDRSFKFKIPIDSDLSDDNLLCAKFVVVAVTNTEKIIIDAGKYITNPEMLAQTMTSYTKPLNKKGISISAVNNTLVTEAQVLGVKNTYFTIQINRLLTLDDTQYAHITDGHTYYFNEDYLAQTDTALKNLYNANLSVTVFLTLQASSDEELNRILLHPDADRTKAVNGYAFNTETDEGVRYLHAVFDFLAKRYSSKDITYGRINNYIIGNRVNIAYRNYNMGEKSLSEFISSYSSAVRIAYNTIKSVSSAPQIYISLTNQWDEGLPAASKLKYDGRAVIDVLAAQIKHCGDISWNLAYDTYPNDTVGYRAWSDSTAENRYSSDVISMKNIETLCRYMSRQSLWYAGNATPRSILIIEQVNTASASDREFETLAAYYAYSYYKINTKACSLIDAYMISRRTDYNNVIKYIDTQQSLESTEFAKRIIGISEWSEAVEHFDESLVIKRSLTEKEILTELPELMTGTMALWEFDTDNTNGWSPAEYCSSVTAGNTLADRSSLLKVQFEKNSTFLEYRAIENKLSFAVDFSCAPYITFNTQFSMLPNGVKEVEMLIIIYSGDNQYRASGIINSSEWNYIALDMTGFAGLNAIDDMKIFLRGVNGTDDIGEPLMFVSDFAVHSDEYGSDHIEADFRQQYENHLASGQNQLDTRVVWILVTVILVASTLLIIHTLSGREEKKDDENPFKF